MRRQSQSDKRQPGTVGQFIVNVNMAFYIAVLADIAMHRAARMLLGTDMTSVFPHFDEDDVDLVKRAFKDMERLGLVMRIQRQPFSKAAKCLRDLIQKMIAASHWPTSSLSRSIDRVRKIQSGRGHLCRINRL